MQIVVTENDQLHMSLGDGFEGLLHKVRRGEACHHLACLTAPCGACDPRADGEIAR